MIDKPSSSIDESGFTAILRGETCEQAYRGVLGAPRINPTATGLSIEDSCAVIVERMHFDSIEDLITLLCDCGRDARPLASDTRRKDVLADNRRNTPAKSGCCRLDCDQACCRGSQRAPFTAQMDAFMGRRAFQPGETEQFVEKLLVAA